MAEKAFPNTNCETVQVLEQIGDRWTLLLVREALCGTSTFNGFQCRLGIARNILANRLSNMVRNGIMLRELRHPYVNRYDYLLTDKGAGLLPVLLALMHWGSEWALGASSRPGDAE